jgi:bifunctional non-homologous end joining protein LigD
MIWDRGRWIPDGDPQFGLSKGHLAFSLEGTRLKGRFHLVRMRPRSSGSKKQEWLLIKAHDEFARPAGASDVTDDETTSYVSGRSIEELAAQGQLRTDHARRTKIVKARDVTIPDVKGVRGAKKGLLPTFLEPSLARLCERPPSGAKWIHEIKHDGYRMQARVDGGKVKLLTRTGLDWTTRFPSVAKALAGLGLRSAWIDGEIVVEDRPASREPTTCSDLKAGRQDRLAITCLICTARV